MTIGSAWTRRRGRSWARPRRPTRIPHRPAAADSRNVDPRSWIVWPWTSAALRSRLPVDAPEFEYTWDEFVGLPSRLSAQADSRDARRRLMDGVLLRGYARDYRGERTARSGRRFWIEDTTIWNLLDTEGVLHGQAALIRGWSDV
ncbi:MEKHLA domain-containing protein [Parafrankia discariae]|uniref:MEKHLA domain-containing protein n=1 Tax=Parafrankia discariae TaxID=365528 RepID=UPI0012B69AE4|nr:MEKHLA domain-containing protein [Parafrankia discariae]